MQHEPSPYTSLAPISEEQIVSLKLNAEQFQHAWLRDAAHEKLSAKRSAVVDVLEAFISTITGRPVPRLDSDTVNRVAGYEEVPHPQAALRK